MSTSGSRETRAVTKGAQGFTFEEAQLKKAQAAHNVHDGAFDLEHSDGEHGAASNEDQSDYTGSDRTAASGQLIQLLLPTLREPCQKWVSVCRPASRLVHIAVPSINRRM